MNHKKQVNRLEELMLAIHDAQVDMARDGFAIDNYETLMGNFQRSYYSLTGKYYSIRNHAEGKSGYGGFESPSYPRITS